MAIDVSANVAADLGLYQASSSQGSLGALLRCSLTGLYDGRPKHEPKSCATGLDPGWRTEPRHLLGRSTELEQTFSSDDGSH